MNAFNTPPSPEAVSAPLAPLRAIVDGLSRCRSIIAATIVALAADAIQGAAAPRPTPDPRVATLLQQLGNDDYQKREEARRHLERLVHDVGAIHAAQLTQIEQAALTHPDIEVRNQARELRLAYNSALHTELKRVWGKRWPMLAALDELGSTSIHLGYLRDATFLYDIRAGTEAQRHDHRFATGLYMQHVVLERGIAGALTLLKRMEKNEGARGWGK